MNGPILAQALMDALAEREAGPLGLCTAPECSHPAVALTFIRQRGEWGDYAAHCACCMVRAKLERAREYAARIPKLEKELAKACEEYLP